MQIGSFSRNCSSLECLLPCLSSSQSCRAEDTAAFVILWEILNVGTEVPFFSRIRHRNNIILGVSMQRGKPAGRQALNFKRIP